MSPDSQIQHSKKRKVQVVDPEFDTSVNEFIDAVIAEKQRKFQSIESFEVHAKKIREKVRGALYDFRIKYRRGLETICQWLDAHGIQRPNIHRESLGIFEDTDTFINAQTSGKPIYELLGFTPEVMTNLYKAAYQFVQDKEFEKGRDAFYFLATIAPDTCDFWLGLAISCTHLKEHEAALDASLRAIEIDPTNSAGYINAIHLYVLANNIDKALELCKQGIDFASNHSQEPTSQGLHSVLEEAQNSIFYSF